MGYERWQMIAFGGKVFLEAREKTLGEMAAKRYDGGGLVCSRA